MGVGIKRHINYIAWPPKVSSPLHVMFGVEWPTIDEIIKGETTNMVYKSINNLAPKYLCNLFTKTSSRDIITLRNSELDLYVPFMNTKSGQKSFSYRGAQLWNGLKYTTKNAPSLFTFKRAIKKKL